MRSVLSLILIYCLTITTVFAQSVNPNDQLKIGKASSSSDKGIVFDTNDGVSNKKLLIEKISKKLKFDGNTLQIGDGSATSNKELIIAGALKSLKYNGTTGEFEFNDDVKLSGTLKADFLQAVNTEIAINSLLRATQGIKIGSGANEIRVSGGNLEFSNDGTLFKKFGTGSGGASSGISILENASFEDGITTGWTSSGGTFSQQTYTSSVEGNTKYARFVATGSGQYIETTLKTIPTNFSGGCQADFKSVNVSANDLFKVEVLDSSANILSSGNVKSSSWVKFPTISFVCPTAGSQVKLRLTSLSAGTIEVDDAYVGSNQNLVYSSQAKWVGSIDYGVSLNCVFDAGTGNTSYVPYPADSDCSLPVASGDVQSTGLKKPEFRLNQKAGTYYFVTSNSIITSGASLKAFRLYNVTDAVQAGSPAQMSNADSVVHGFNTTYQATTNGLKTFEFQHKATGSNSVVILSDGSTANISADRNFKVDVYFYPASSDIAVSPEQASWFIDANIGGANIDMSVNSSYFEMTNPNLDLVVNTNKGSAQAEIACASGTASVGLNCNGPAVSESVGISFIPPMAGLYRACFSLGYRANASGFIYNVMQLMETSNTSSTILTEGGERPSAGANGGIYVAGSRKICGNFIFSDTSKKTLRLMWEQSNSGLIESTILADRSASDGQRDIHVYIENLSFNQNRPFLTGDQVTTKGAVNPEIFSFSLGGTAINNNCTTGTCFVDQIGNYVSSIIRSSAGTYPITLAKTVSKLKCGTNNANNTKMATITACNNCSSSTIFISNSANTLLEDGFATFICHVLP